MYKLLTLSQCLKIMKVKPIVSKKKIKSCLLGEVETPIDELIFKNGVYYYNQNSEEWEEDDEKA